MANILIDTHIWLWSRSEPERFSRSARDAITDPRNRLILSVVSVTEIAIKYAIGKLVLPEPPSVFVPPRLAEDGITILPLHLVHGLALAGLPMHHRDPFDRMLVAQAQCENLPILTADRRFEAYDVEVVAAC